MQNMRKQLFEITITRDTGTATAHVVATDEDHAALIVEEHARELDLKHQSIDVRRVDDVMEPDKQLGLDAMLDIAPTGFASFFPSLGWIMHTAAIQWLRLYRAEDEHGEGIMIIAPNVDVASALYVQSLDLAEGEGRLFRVVDWLEDIPADQLHNLPALIEFGPVGVVEFDGESGWFYV